jgi:DNA-binding MurR/RpiR family transcriptional regulator
MFLLKVFCYNPFRSREDPMTTPTPMDEELRLALPDLTRAERQLASHVLSNYPVAALGSITALAKAAGVSSPTVVRLVQKLGYKGYPDFQRALRGQVEAMLVSPLAKQTRAAGAHVLTRFASAVIENLEATLGQLDPAEFDKAAALLADPSRRIFAMGGRITHAMADYFVTLMKVIRPDVLLMSDMSNAWPPAMLDLKAGDVMLVFDIRRYENAVLQVAEMAREQGAEIILVTDRWVSPAAAFASHVLPCHIEAPSAWDSNVSLMVMVEALLAAVQGLTWDVTEGRMKRLEELYTRTRLFRRYR